jgi:hypothetical protein
MARTLDQIIAELNPTYQAQRESIQQQQSLIPGQIASQEQALSAQKDKGYADILSGARRRGTGVAFGGIPLAEQAQYNATQYMPALANLRTAGTQQAMSLQDALNQINERQQTTAQSIYQTEQDRAFQERQAVLNRQAQAASAFNPTQFLNDFMQQGQGTLPEPRYVYDEKKGFNFFDGNSQPVRAFNFSQMTGVPFRKLLSDMAAKGDNNARIALQFVGNDGKFWQAPESAKNALSAVGAIGNFAKTPITAKGIISGAPSTISSTMTNALKYSPTEQAMANFWGINLPGVKR